MIEKMASVYVWLLQCVCVFRARNAHYDYRP